jgi:nitroreductase
MKMAEAVLARQAVRAFRPDPVPEATIRDLLGLARHAPSGGNLQPWHVHVLTGPAREALVADVRAKLDAGQREPPGYQIYPKDLWEPLRSRRRDAGAQRYAALNVPRALDGQLELERRNLAFFGAPVGLFFSLDRRAGPPQWADIGMFMQTLMLLATARGLATCPQEVWSTWSVSVAAALCLPDHLMLFAGMSLGYADTASPMNGYRTPRADVDEFATFLVALPRAAG